MAEKLTAQQQQAVDHRGSNLLVSAAAGSGKTKVLVDRLMGYLTDSQDPANMDDFLMITFTKAAAGELRGKIADKLSKRIAQEPDNRHLQQQMQRLYLAKVSTVHSFCTDILREYAYRLDIAGDFRVAEEKECLQLQESVLEKILETAYTKAEPDFCAFIDTQGFQRDDRQIQEIVLQVYERSRSHMHPDGWLGSCAQMVDTEGITDVGELIYGKFLMERLFRFLDGQIPAWEKCIDMIGDAPAYSKACDLLRDNLYMLQKLRASEIWDSIGSYKALQFGTLRFPTKEKMPEVEAQIKTFRDNCKKRLETVMAPFASDSAQLLTDLDSVKPAMRGLISLVQEFAHAFDQAKRSRQILDFSDLEQKALDLLLGKQRTGPTAAALEIGSRFREVMVDEYQDSNEVQDAIYGALTCKKNNLFMVGDVKQSIYQFRLADPTIFLKKYQSFCPKEDALPGQDTKVLLSSNFRSGGGVLSAANYVFRSCMCEDVGDLNYGAEEALYEGIAHVPLGEAETEFYVLQIREKTYPEEAAFAAQRIRELLDGTHFVRDGEALRPIRPEDIAILLRSPNSQGHYYQSALEKLGIRSAAGGGVDLLQTQEVGTLWTLLQTIHNPVQDIPLVATMASPVFGFTADDLAAIRSKHKYCAFYDAVRQDSGPKSRAFLNCLQNLREAVRHNSLTGLLSEIYLQTNLDGIFAAMDDGAMRMSNLQSFYQVVAEFEAGGNRDLGRLLEHLQAMQEKGLTSPGEQSSPDCVTIMSIHKSKGLEFPVVLLCGLSKTFNKMDIQKQVLCHKKLGLGLSASDSQKRIYFPTIAKRAIAAKLQQEMVSEEMRVLYVAMTRARDRLIMTYSSRTPEKELSELTANLNLGGKDLLIRQAVSEGQWVLLSAMHRIEAGELFALGGKPENTELDVPAWHIRLVEAPNADASAEQQGTHRQIPADVMQMLRQNLRFTYPHMAATAAPSKMTATQRKGRLKDREAAEDTISAPVRHRWRKPGFRAPSGSGTDYGTAMHAALQYIRYDQCAAEAGVEQEIRRLVDEKFITQEQGALVNSHKLAVFFASPLGHKLCSSPHVEREFKFSVLEDGAAYDPALAGEQVLLQGVVDCALIEEDGITLIDYKTDYVTEETIEQAVRRYMPQVQAYGQALERIFQKPVKEALLYFFCLDKFRKI